MAEEQEKEQQGEPEAEAPKKNRGPLKLLVGVVSLVAFGVLGAFFALPSKSTPKRFKGPFHSIISEEKIAVNLRDNDGKRYLQMNGEVLFFAYDEEYLTRRQNDPFYQSMLINAINRISSDKYMEDVHSGARRELFIEELREGIEPIASPVHVGETAMPYARDTESGLRPGVSAERSTFRGRFWEHELTVDSTTQTLRLDAGPEVHYTGVEEDLRVIGTDGSVLYVDVTAVEEGFQDTIHVGVHGTIRRLIETEYVFQ
jgi:flagellar basal body-associated protein FliL